jgi:hypothetical protein
MNARRLKMPTTKNTKKLVAESTVPGAKVNMKALKDKHHQPAPEATPQEKAPAKKVATKKTATKKATAPKVSFTAGAIATATRKLGGGFEVLKDGDKYQAFFLDGRTGKRILRRTVDTPEKVMKFLCSRSRISPFVTFQATDEKLSKLAEQKDYRPIMAAA